MTAPVRLPLITVSRAKSFRRCPRHHHYAYELGFRSAADAGPLAFGKLWHAMLELWWRPGPGVPLAEIFATLPPELDPFERVKLEELMNGYDARWSDVVLVPLAVETEFETDLVNPQSGAASRTWRLAGKIDAIAREGERVYVVEHKTTSEDVSPGSPYWQKLRLDSQVSTYLVGARALGHEPEGVLYDVVAKPQLRPLKATPVEQRKYRKSDGALYESQRAEDETPEEFRSRLRAAILANPERYYARGDVVRLLNEEQDAAFDMWQTARAIREAELANRWPRNPDACFQWARACEFFDVCTGAARLEDTSRFRKIDNQHEELSNAGSNATAAE